MAATLISKSSRLARLTNLRLTSPLPVLSTATTFPTVYETPRTLLPNKPFDSRADPRSWLPFSMLFGIFGIGSIGSCYSDAGGQEERNPHMLPYTVSPELMKLVGETKDNLKQLLHGEGMQLGSYPPFTVSATGQKVTVKFRIPLACDLSELIVDLVEQVGLKAEQGGNGSEMLLRAWDSVAAWQLTLSPTEKTKESSRENREDDLCILIFESFVGSEYREIEFIKKGSFELKELNAIVLALKFAGEKKISERGQKGYTHKRGDVSGSFLSSVEKSVSALQAMGVQVYGLDNISGVPIDGSLTWENIAGYDKQKREIEDTILLALQHPEVYDGIASGTRRKFESNRPRAVLFEGPPGTGKTSSARVIAKQAGVPLLYVPLEVILSKYYGESEKLLGNVFTLANDFPYGAIIFLDEVDSFAVARDNEMHEATRRILSVILRQIDGFEQDKKVVVIAATNRTEDLDPALISRFDSMILFPLPDQQTREEIAAQYAKHLKKSELMQFASATEEMSGRDIKDVCQQAERHWASKLIRGQAPKDVDGNFSLPPIEEYIQCAEQRREALLASAKGNVGSPSKKNRALTFA